MDPACVSIFMKTIYKAWCGSSVEKVGGVVKARSKVSFCGVPNENAKNGRRTCLSQFYKHICIPQTLELNCFGSKIQTYKKRN